MVTTLIKCRHGLISRSNLNLHEESLSAPTFGTHSFCPIHVLPRLFTTEDIIYLLLGKLQLLAHLPPNWIDIRASWAVKPKASAKACMLHKQQICTSGAELHILEETADTHSPLLLLFYGYSH
eukprot:c19665_g1_i1 orf=1-366(-)